MKLLHSVLSGLFLGNLICLSATAQVTTDGTTSTTITNTDTGVQIDNGDRAGGNLFHSFGEFSVPNGSEAFFNNANDISNIFSRVTGGNISNINGLLRANGAANLFLINPAGILFGEGARLQLGGSFYGSTADSIVFPDGEFSATDLDNPPLITINAPIGLGFRDNPRDITVSGNGNGTRTNESEIIDTQEALRVGTDNTIGLIGGNIIFENATVKTAGGRIELGSVAGGQVDLVEVAEGFTFDYSAIENFSDISVTGTNSIDASGDGGGAINVMGKSISLDGLSQLIAFTLGSIPGKGITIGSEQSPVESLSVTNGAEISVSTFSEGDAGDLAIFADNIELDRREGGARILTAQVESDATGNGGNINIGSEQSPASEFRLLNAGRILVSTRGEGNAGNVTIFADNIEINGGGGNSRSRLNAETFGTGKGGNITFGNEQSPLEALRIVNGASVSVTTRNQGNAGEINIFAKDIKLDRSGSESNTALLATALDEAQGNAGIINIGSEQSLVNTLSITNGASVFVTTRGEGNAGEINIFAKDIKLDRGGSDFGFVTGFSAEVLPEAEGNLETIGNGGRINIGSEQFPVETLKIFNGAGIAVSSFGEGDAGEINVFAKDIELDGAGSDFVTELAVKVLPEAKGDGGRINIGSEPSPVETLKIINGAEISASNGGQGNGGNIKINALKLELLDEGQIKADSLTNVLIASNQDGIILTPLDEPISGLGNAGTIEITVDNITLQDKGKITAVSTSGEGGDINLQVADLLSLRNNSEISTEAGQLNTPGNGGDIDIDAELIFAFPNTNSDIKANAFDGAGGNINITSEGIIGIEARPLNNVTNDINADSQLGISGNVSINTPDNNPLRENTEVSSEVVAKEIVSASNSCAAKDIDDESGLVVKGKGGVPPEPTEPFDGLAIIEEEDLTTTENSVGTIHESPLQENANIDESSEQANTRDFDPNYIPPHIKPVTHDENGEPIYIARGLIVKPDGGIILTAYPTPGTPGYREYQQQLGCEIQD